MYVLFGSCITFSLYYNETNRQIFLRFQNAFYVLVTEEAKSKSVIKTNVSQKILTVGTPVNMRCFGQKLSPWNNQKDREQAALKKCRSERKRCAYMANLAELLKVSHPITKLPSKPWKSYTRENRYPVSVYLRTMHSMRSNSVKT